MGKTRTIAELINRPKSMTKNSPVTEEEREMLRKEADRIYFGWMTNPRDIDYSNHKTARVIMANNTTIYNYVHRLQRAIDTH